MNNYYVVDDDNGSVLTGPLSKESAENFIDEHDNCHIVEIVKY